jgi:hypothetical protein
VQQVVSDARELAGTLMKSGVFVRGGIAIGWAYHKSNVLFGDGVVIAYELETHVSRVPRIVLNDDVAGQLDKKDFGHKVKQDADGFWFLNPFVELFCWENWFGEASAIPDPEQYRKVGEYIRTGLAEALKHGPDLVSKYRWLALQFNAAVKETEWHPPMKEVERVDV